MVENQAKETAHANTHAIAAAEQSVSLASDDLAILSLYVSLLSSFVDLASLQLEKGKDVSNLLAEDDLA